MLSVTDLSNGEQEEQFSFYSCESNLSPREHNTVSKGCKSGHHNDISNSLACNWNSCYLGEENPALQNSEK